MSMKRASLNLSIQTIVVVVIAMILLGLGLGFVRSQFKSIGETTTTIQEQVRQQILEDLRTGNKKLSFPTNEVKMGRGESKIIAVGVMNQLDCAGDFNISIEKQEEEGEDLLNSIQIPGAFTLNPTEAKVVPIRLVAGITSGTTIYRIIVGYTPTTGSTDCIRDEKYATKDFFITVS